MSKKVIVIGGSAAGPKAAARARRLDEFADITIIQKEPDFSMASCGFPYYIEGVFDNRNALIATPTGVVRDSNFFLNAKNIKAKANTEVIKIDKESKQVVCKNLLDESIDEMTYDKLIIATGATPKMPPFEGRDLKGITTLHSMKDSDFLKDNVVQKKVKHAVIVGAGLIGIEACEALRKNGIEVTVIEMLPQILPFLDIELSKLVENHAASQGVNFILEKSVSRFKGENGSLIGVELSDGSTINCDLAIVSIGVNPNTIIAKQAGIQIGDFGGIITNAYMQTSDPDIYAAGDCVEINHLITQKNTLAPMGDLANLEARVAGENVILGNTAVFKGTIQTGICKIFDMSAGISGFSEKYAKRENIEYVSAMNTSLDKPGFMSGQLLISKILVDKKTNTIIGYQSVGFGDVSRQIASASIAIMGKLNIDDLACADMPYAPPFSLAIDHFIASTHIVQNKIKGLFVGINVRDVKQKIDNHEDCLIIDVRSSDEFRELKLGIGEKHIPLGMLRKKLNELPEDKNKEIITYCKISLRGYEASLILKAHGYKNVKVMEGGIMAWPYKK